MKRLPPVHEMTNSSSETDNKQSQPVKGIHVSIIEEAWSVCGGLYCQAAQAPKSIDPEALDREMLFCLLGGFGITYELCQSATASIVPLRPFSIAWNDDDLFEALFSTLAQARFEPARHDGSLRRYRFPKRKASLLVEARR